MVSSEEDGPAHSPFLFTTQYLLSFAQAALELPAVAGAGDGDDVEIQPLVRVARRDEHDLAQKRPAALLVALGLEHLQILVVQLAARRCLALIGGLDHGHVGKSAARQADERAGPGDRLPHAPSPSAQHTDGFCCIARECVPRLIILCGQDGGGKERALPFPHARLAGHQSTSLRRGNAAQERDNAAKFPLLQENTYYNLRLAILLQSHNRTSVSGSCQVAVK